MAQPGSATGKKDAARVAVVAEGVISPLGFGLTETLDSLRKSRDCVSPVKRFSVAQCRCKTAGQVSDDRLLAGRGEAPRSRRLHRASHMMIQALKEVLAQEPRFEPELTVIGTTSGGMSYGEYYYRSLRQAGDLRRAPTWIANYPAQKPVIDAQVAFGISAPCQVIANACASGTNAIGHAFECVRSGRYQRVLAGGYDAISELVFTGFDSLQASTPEKCRPFDRQRTGMVLLHWKTSPAPGSEARLFSQRLSATVFLPIIFTSHSRILPASEPRRRCNKPSKARTFQRRQSITSMRTEQRRCSMTQPKARQSARYLTACQ